MSYSQSPISCNNLFSIQHVICHLQLIDSVKVLYTCSTGHMRLRSMIYCLKSSLLLHSVSVSNEHTLWPVMYITITMLVMLPRGRNWKALPASLSEPALTHFIKLFYHPWGIILTVTVTSHRAVHLCCK